MKERTVIEDFTCNDNCKRKDCEICFKERSKKEQVPENWEDLKELCLELNNKIKDIDVNCVYNEHIIIQWYNDDNTDVDIYKDGTIFVENHLVADNRTIEQMWQIIKGLIGE